MPLQESLTFLFDAIALGFTFIVTIDLSREIIALYNQTFVSSQQPILPSSYLQQLPPLPDPWLRPVAETLDSAEQITQVQPKPLLLLAPVSSVVEVEGSINQLTPMESLGDIDVDTLKLRDARKLAKALGIAQKINGKDQNLKFLKSQIKLKLQQDRVLKPEITAQLKGELIAS